MMHAAPSSPDLGERLKAAWNDSDKPKPVIGLVPIGADPGMQLRRIAEELAIQFIPVRLSQVVTPEQHGLFTQDRPRLVAVYGIDRLTPGERDAFARLLGKGPKTFIVVICPAEAAQAEKISAAWATVRRLEAVQLQRGDQLANLTSAETPARAVDSPS
jgi:hypothetical protein